MSLSNSVIASTDDNYIEESVKLTDELQERQLIERFNKQCRDAIAYARKKHPEFARYVAIDCDVGSLKSMLKTRMSMNEEYAEEGRSNVLSLIYEEVIEFLLALAEGDKDHAEEEAAHVYAVMWRALRGEHIASHNLERK